MLLYAESIGSVTKFLTVLFLFIFVLFITYFTTRYIANFQKGKMSGRNIKIIETTRLSQNKYLQIIEAGGEYFLIAVCKDTITSISKLDGDKLSLPEEGEEPPRFKDVLEKAKNKLTKKDDTK